MTGEPCLHMNTCVRYQKLADLLGHDQQGHAMMNALTRAGITSLTALAAADLHGIRGLGVARRAFIFKRLRETGTSLAATWQTVR